MNLIFDVKHIEVVRQLITNFNKTENLLGIYEKDHNFYFVFTPIRENKDSFLLENKFIPINNKRCSLVITKSSTDEK